MRQKVHLAVIIFVAAFSQSVIKAQEIVEKIHPKEVITGVFLGETVPLRDLPVLSKEEVAFFEQRALAKAARKVIKPREYPFAETALPKGPDEVWQKTMGVNRASNGPIVNFEGQTTTSFPPDCNGVAGPNHFMQTVNVTYAIYNKSGAILAGPTALNTLFSGVPGATVNDGDPIVLYDEAADRWFVAEFTMNLSNDYMLVAVSSTNDPTGTWYKYSFDVTNDPDYPKFGVWSDGYYMGINSTAGSDIYVFEKAKMLLGQTAQLVGFDNPWRPGNGFLCVPPLDNDGTSSPDGTPGMFIAFNDDGVAGGTDQLWIYELDVNWSNIASSTFTRTQQINVTPFDSQFNANWDDITQPNTQKLDGVPQVIMNAPQYRNFGTYETILACHTVDVDATNHAGIRWYELRRTSPSTTWTIRQQGTYAPDQHSRWMGSIMLNGSGKIALGYSISSSTVYPGIRYTGQSASAYANATGTFDIEEQIIHSGTVAQTTYNRWGDYALLSVDPTDDQTFWFSSQYVKSGGTNKGTKIASFKFGNDPTVTTLPVSNLTGTSVSLNGSVNPNGLATNYHFQWGTTIAFGNTTAVTSAGSGNSVSNVSASLTGLTPGQTYYYRISATNADGTSNGETLSFVPGGVVLTTAAISGINTNQATGGGTITEDGGSTVTARGVCWATSENPTVGANNFTTDGTGTGTFSSTITGLSSSTTYYVRAYATNSNGTFYGNQVSFVTLCGVFGLPISETFATTNLPTCWEITDFVGAGQTWKIGTITGYTPNPSLTGNYAYINSDGYGSGSSQNTDLLSPVLDLTSYTNVNLSFSHYFRQYLSASTVSLYYSVNGGTSWTLIQSWTASTANPATFNQTIAALAGQSQVRFRWNFIGTYAYYWAVDNISVTGTASGTTLSVSPSNRDVAATAGSTTFDVTSNTNWTATSNQTWCTVTPSGNSNGTITANFTENTIASPRIATITVSASGASNVNVTVTQAGVTSNPAATIVLRPQQIDLSASTSKSAVLVNLSNYSTNDVKYRLYNGGNQYNCWDGTQFVTSSSYSANPSVPGTPSTDVTWWIMFERGTNNSATASYRDRLGPGYSTNNLTVALPAATAIIISYTIDDVLPLTAKYPLDQRYVVLAYDAEIAGNLLSATTSEVTSGTFSLVLSDASVVRRIEVRNIMNVLMESLTGIWQAGGDPQIFTLTGGGSYCSASLPSGISANLSGSENGVSYQLLRNGSAEGNAVSGTGNALVWNDLTEGSYTVTATNASASVNMNGTAVVATEQPSDVAVSITADQSSVCQGSLMTFNAMPVNGGSNPVFAWTLNGQAAGSNSSSFSFAPANGDVVAVSLTSSLGCVSGNPAVSNSIQAVVSPMIQASVEISSNLNGVCQGTQVEFTAIPVNGGSNPFYQWLINGVSTGSNSSSFSYTPANGDLVSVVMTSVAECLVQNPVSSDALTMSVTPSATVLVSVLPDANPVCAGTLVSFSASAFNAGSNPVYQWMVNGLAAGSNLPTFAYVPANGDIIEVFLSSDVPCSLNNPAQSNMVVMQVISIAPASVSLTASQTSLCLGQSALLMATPVNGGTNPTFAWTVNGQATGSNNGSFSFVPADGDMVQVTMTSSLGCVSGSPALSNQVAFNVTAPSVAVLASPDEAGTVAYSGSVALNASVHLTAAAHPGWNFVNWTDQFGSVVSELATFDFIVQECQNVLTAHFSAGNSIAGKLLFFNPLESAVPSPYNGGAFYVQLFDGLLPVGEAVMVNQGEPFVFNGLLAQKQYSLRIWDQPAANLNSNAWTWNNWGGVSALDALIVNYMTTENPVVQNFPWIASAATPQNTPFAFELADANASNSLTALDALLLMYRSVGYPGTSPFPGGKHNFIAFAEQTNNLSLPTYPEAPQITFQRFGSYTPNSPASSVYQQASLPLTNPGLNSFKVFLTPTGDVNASYVPENDSKSQSILDFTSEIFVSVNQILEVAVQLEKAINLGAFTLELSYDEKLIEVLEVVDREIHFIDKDNSTVKIAWLNDSQNMVQTLAILKVKIKSYMSPGDSYFQLLDGTQLVDESAKVFGGHLQVPTIKTIDANDLENKLVHYIAPNPASGNTNLHYFLPEDGVVRISLFDPTGHEIKKFEAQTLSKGDHMTKISQHDLLGSGLYFYKIDFQTAGLKSTVSGSMLFVK